MEMDAITNVSRNQDFTVEEDFKRRLIHATIN
jgi:hypothetical protein